MRNIGVTVTKRSKEGGGSWTVIGHINCPRVDCGKVIEEREQQTPSKLHRKAGYYWQTWSLCPHCGLYSHGSKKIFI